jgi:hypothetical protein
MHPDIKFTATLTANFSIASLVASVNSFSFKYTVLLVPNISLKNSIIFKHPPPFWQNKKALFLRLALTYY